MKGHGVDHQERSSGAEMPKVSRQIQSSTGRSVRYARPTSHQKARELAVDEPEHEHEEPDVENVPEEGGVLLGNGVRLEVEISQHEQDRDRVAVEPLAEGDSSALDRPCPRRLVEEKHQGEGECRGVKQVRDEGVGERGQGVNPRGAEEQDREESEAEQPHPGRRLDRAPLVLAAPAPVGPPRGADDEEDQERDRGGRGHREHRHQEHVARGLAAPVARAAVPPRGRDDRGHEEGGEDRGEEYLVPARPARRFPAAAAPACALRAGD